jgi:predicted peroxiredoxin
MATFIISGSRGTDDPTMATLPFMAAKTAKEQGHDVILWLWNEAVTLSRKGTADHLHGVNLTPLKDLLAAVHGPACRFGSVAPVRWRDRLAVRTLSPVRPLGVCQIT